MDILVFDPQSDRSSQNSSEGLQKLCVPLSCC